VTRRDDPAGEPGFEGFRATELYCDLCRRSQPVRAEPATGDDGKPRSVYLCTVCGNEVGEHFERSGDDAPEARRAPDDAPKADAAPTDKGDPPPKGSRKDFYA